MYLRVALPFPNSTAGRYIVAHFVGLAFFEFGKSDIKE